MMAALNLISTRAEYLRLIFPLTLQMNKDKNMDQWGSIMEVVAAEYIVSSPPMMTDQPTLEWFQSKFLELARSTHTARINELTMNKLSTRFPQFRSIFRNWCLFRTDNGHPNMWAPWLFSPTILRSHNLSRFLHLLPVVLSRVLCVYCVWCDVPASVSSPFGV